MRNNSENPRAGADFQRRVADVNGKINSIASGI